jgi:nicotinate-nucleotide adenylyltransferase
MVSLAVEDNPSFSISDIELKREGLSYTVDTLRHLRSLHPGGTIHFVTGSDVLDEIHTWKDPEEIYELAKVVIATRPGFDSFDPENHFAEKSIVLQITGVDISASEIRERVKRGRSIRYLVPFKVEEYIRRRKLYRR